MPALLNSNFDRRGFTLVELVVVLAIMAIVAALAVPRYANSLARYRADAAARRIASDIELLQSRAYSRNATHSAVFSVVSNSYLLAGILDPDHPNLPYTVRLADPPYFAVLKSANFAGSNALAFDAYGQPASAGVVVISVGSEQRTISVELSSGRSKVQ